MSQASVLKKMFGFQVLFVAGAVSVCSGADAAMVEKSSDIVGEVTTIIGTGVVKTDTGQETALQRGVPVHAGDRIETAAGGHVHIRFIDGGLVSVRPLSRLYIESYRNEGSWGPAAIKFKLEEGVMRSVTGKWGEAARDRFRLNTPVAAIGVKGTDFVVKVDHDRTYASVISGAIVMAPLDGACAQSLGPCSGDRSAMLSADMQGKMLELIHQSGAGVPRLVPAVDLQAQMQRQMLAGETRRERMSGTSDAAEKISANDAAAVAAVDKDNKHLTPPSKPLIWLHNTAGWNVPDNTISERFDEAKADGRKAVTGNFFITLYRDETTQSTFLPVGTQVSFNLTAASASYQPQVASGLPAQAVQISNASLNVDFTRSTFSTRMDLASSSLGQETFSANGVITSTGLFNSNSANQNLAGAFSTDGRQAGYSFDKTTSGGKVSGITLWGR
ncbi:MAG: hypothetical protein D3M94_15880 [Rhodocyclales bacterium GT-UBC]|nr:MAG: hypothetical protein D3M94_15880 [Rhodocyclales bacterium GT-UBC]